MFSFVNAHLEAHDHNILRRNTQYQRILSSLVFNSTDPLTTSQQIFETSHLFFMGDLNYRLSKQPLPGALQENDILGDVLEFEKSRMAMLDTDTLRQEQREGRVFGGLREGDLTGFAPTYKRIVGQVEGYSKYVHRIRLLTRSLFHAHRKRIPGWTDRILFASHTDPPHLFSPHASLDPVPSNVASTTTILHFNSTPGLVISDHKPVHAILSLPEVSHETPSPHLAPVLPPAPSPHRPRPIPTQREVLMIEKFFGTLLDRLIGWPWCIIVLLGFGNTRTGMGVSAFVAMIWGIWWSGLYSR